MNNQKSWGPNSQNQKKKKNDINHTQQNLSSNFPVHIETTKNEIKYSMSAVLINYNDRRKK